MSQQSIAPPPSDLPSIVESEDSLILPHFTAADAWAIGSALRARLLPFPASAVVSISLANNNQLLFHCTTGSGTAPDNDIWVARKRKTVLRWGHSSWWMHNKMKGDEAAFKAKYALGETAGDYAIHGGGWPVRVKGVEGVVAVIVVSGLKQEEDHGIIVEVLGNWIASERAN